MATIPRFRVMPMAGLLLQTGCGNDQVVEPAAASPPSSMTVVGADTAKSTSSALPTTFPSTQSTSITDSVASTPPATQPVTVTTEWTPPSITWPTTPYTLPDDYGVGPPVARDIDAPPRATYPPDVALPPMAWTVDPHLTVRFTPPDSFRQDPMPLPAVQDYDRAHGLYVRERWLVKDEPTLAGLSVQANPGNESPLLSRQEFSDSIATDDLTWHLWNGETVRHTGKPPNFGLAVSGDYLFIVSGTPNSMRAIIDGLNLDR